MIHAKCGFGMSADAHHVTHLSSKGQSWRCERITDAGFCRAVGYIMHGSGIAYYDPETVPFVNSSALMPTGWP